MSPDARDPDKLKAQQREEWDAAASGWAKWWHVFERGASTVSERLCDRAALDTGWRVLDIATGMGEPALTAARRVGAAGRVLAVDQSAGMIAAARRRAQELGIMNAEFRVADAEHLELGEDGFNAALCRWGLMFMPDLEAVLAAVRRRLKPGGVFVTCVWGAPERVPMISLGGDEVRRIAGIPARRADALDPFRLSDSRLLVDAFERAGFQHLQVEKREVVFEFESPEVFTTFRREVSAPLRTLLARKPAAVGEAVVEAMTEAARRYAGGRGALRLVNELVCVSGQAPG